MKDFKGKFIAGLKRYSGILVVLVVFFIVNSVFTDTFLSTDNIILVARQTATSCMLGFGLTIVLASGSFDLSLGAVYGLCGVLSGLWCLAGWPIWINIPVVILIAMAFGFVNGIVITKTLVPAFIATLGTQYISTGISYLISGGRNYALMVDSFNVIGTGRIFGLPIQIYYALFLFIVLGLLLNRTRTGRYIQATGSSMIAAQFAGINTTKIKIIVHVLCSALAGFAGITNTARLFNVSPANEANPIDAICAVVIGGTSMAGGNGTLVGTLFGAMVMTVLSNGLNHMGLNSYWQQVIKGILIIGAVAFDGYKRLAEERAITRAIVKSEEKAAAAK